jgi:creatinine amidohydrolase
MSTAPDEVMIERMSWTQVRDAMAAGKRTVIVPVAAMEQHGPHMAIGTDTFLGYETSRRLAQALGDALVAPAISIGYSVGHLPMPGTVTVSEETLTTIINEVVDSLAHHGFQDIVLLVSHGGNYGAINAALPELRRKHPGVRIHAQTSFDSAMTGRDALYQELGVEAHRMGVHAGQGETSMMLATHPEYVNMDAAVEGFTGDASIRWKSKVPPPMPETSPTGILGDARNSTAEIGNRLFEHNVQRWVEAIRSGEYCQQEG